MGCDIHGNVEYSYEGKSWYNAIDVRHVGRNYDAFGLLFGVRNYANFKPMAEKRGLPKNISWKTKEDFEGDKDDAHSCSYLGYDEIKKIKLTTISQKNDSRTHEYKITKENGLEYLSKASWSSKIEDCYEYFTETDCITVGDMVYAKEPITVGEVLGCFTDLFDMMKILSKRYGDKNVRMVVWFDC